MCMVEHSGLGVGMLVLCMVSDFGSFLKRQEIWGAKEPSGCYSSTESWHRDNEISWNVDQGGTSRHYRQYPVSTQHCLFLPTINNH